MVFEESCSNVTLTVNSCCLYSENQTKSNLFKLYIYIAVCRVYPILVCGAIRVYEHFLNCIWFVLTYHILNCAALINTSDIFGCLQTNLVHVGEQRHLVNT